MRQHSGISLCRIAADALRFSAQNIAQVLPKIASRIFGGNKRTTHPHYSIERTTDITLDAMVPTAGFDVGSNLRVGRGVAIEVGSGCAQYPSAACSTRLAQLHRLATDHAASLRYSGQRAAKVSDAVRVSDEAVVRE